MWSACLVCSLPSSDLAVSTRIRSSCTQWTQVLHLVPLPVDVSHAPLDVLHINVMWMFTRNALLVAVAVLHASPIPCFVAAMQTTTVTTNIHVVWLVWRMLSSNLLLIGVTYRMELMRMMMDHACERWHVMMTEWDSYQMLFLISMYYWF